MELGTRVLYNNMYIQHIHKTTPPRCVYGGHTKVIIHIQMHGYVHTQTHTLRTYKRVEAPYPIILL